MGKKNRYYYFCAGGTRNRLDFETGKVEWKCAISRKLNNKRKAHSVWKLWYSIHDQDASFIADQEEAVPKLLEVKKLYQRKVRLKRYCQE